MRRGTGDHPKGGHPWQPDKYKQRGVEDFDWRDARSGYIVATHYPALEANPGSPLQQTDPGDDSASVPR